ncbi:glycosyl transferase [candidate division KSB3 bacterium]|uniref:Glycosyl transferase n=1 Tax=candidate division KSB3 bacterium TaxID=2044937 RepID=A0A2G6E576_9BACT|nr:MAG: glycosyl transferase [candidate division KSB3 bacterium]PIE29420.1 MAG: glycosyl transferase [candidate division KSB3 bacterium]
MRPEGPRKNSLWNSLIFCLNWRCLRPLMKKILPLSAHSYVQKTRAKFQPTLVQYPPRPLLQERKLSSTRLSGKADLPLVSIVTPSLNQGAYLRRTIQSVLTQNYPNLEYLIIDGNSHDQTTQILSEYEGRVAHIESRQDAGQAHAINKGFQRSTGEIMGWVNADDLLLSDAIPAVVNFFLEHPELDVVYGFRITIDEQDREIGRWILPSQAEELLPWANYLPQESLFWRRRIWEKVGGSLDESYHFALDWDLWLRFYSAGARFASLPEFIGAFRCHRDQKSTVQAELGRQEAARLHRRYHGYEMPWLEVRHAVGHYLRRCSYLYLLYYMGVYGLVSRLTCPGLSDMHFRTRLSPFYQPNLRLSYRAAQLRAEGE